MTPSFIDRSIAKIRRAIRRAPSNVAFARAAGIHESFVRQAFADHWNPTANTLRKLEEAADALRKNNGGDAALVHGEPEGTNRLGDAA
jgi:hypothetical protein